MDLRYWTGTGWVSLVGPTGPTGPAMSYYVGDTAPSSPVTGDVWFNSAATRTYVFYDNYWVESSSPVTTVGSIDNGFPDSTFGGIAPIDGGVV